MEVNGTYRDSAAAAFANDALKSGSDPVKEACREFEGMMLGIILKQGLTKSEDEDGESAANTSPLMDFSVEQMARELGRSESMGLARMLHEQLAKEGVYNGRND